jgi:hypothetical protein
MKALLNAALITAALVLFTLYAYAGWMIAAALGAR